MSEVAFCDDDPAATQQAIDDFLAASGTQFGAHKSWEELNDIVMTGIPNGEEMEAPEQAAPAATATSVKSEFERSVHPEFCGVKYDELHSTTVKNITKVTGQWPGKKQKFEVDVAKAEAHPMYQASEALKTIKKYSICATGCTRRSTRRKQRPKSMEEATYSKKTWTKPQKDANCFGKATRPSKNT